MFNNKQKLEYYYLLNGIRLKYLKYDEPFNILSTPVKLTYNDIKLKYLTNKKYFIIVDKSAVNNKQSFKNKTDKHDKPSFKNNKPMKFTPEETAAYLERKSRRERSQSPDSARKGGTINKILIYY